MHQPSITAVIAFLLIAAAAGADTSTSTSKPPPAPAPYPKQPNINTALKQLTTAQKQVQSSNSDTTKAIEAITKAHTAMEKSKRNKGSFRITAIRLSGQAIKDLQNGFTDKAAHNLEEAIEAVHKAGKAGEN